MNDNANTLQQTCNKLATDCISRQEAINGFYEMASDMDYLCTVSDYVSFLESLPSAQPSSSCIHENDTISRKVAIDAVCKSECGGGFCGIPCPEVNALKALPPAQSEQAKMIKEIRKWINSENRGSADYFIVDKIEEIINKYEE